MNDCWWCHWGWPKQIRDIYDKALNALDGDEEPLHYGPAHIVWEDENWDAARWCLNNFDVQALSCSFSSEQLAIVRQSLVELLGVPEEFKDEPEAYEGENPEAFPPPKNWVMVK